MLGWIEKIQPNILPLGMARHDAMLFFSDGVAGVDELAVGSDALDGDGVGRALKVVGVEVEGRLAVIAHLDAWIPVERVALVSSRLDATVASIVAW